MVGPGLRQANQVNKFRLPFVFFPFVQKETAIPLFVDLLINSYEFIIYWCNLLIWTAFEAEGYI